MGNTHSVCLLSSNFISRIGSNALSYVSPAEIASKLSNVQAKQQSFIQLHSDQIQQPQDDSNNNILVIDDEPDTLFTYEFFLSEEGYNVKAFSDPQEALKHFFLLPNPSSHYKLALLDIRMPKLNGLQLFHKMKAVSPNMKIMFCSALDIAQEVASVLPDTEHENFIRKPVEREHFINKVNSALSKH
ncbi:MAG: response regulator [Thermoproteota archaeon]|nr:response regulator [Thermoproteota archaeon]